MRYKRSQIITLFILFTLSILLYSYNGSTNRNIFCPETGLYLPPGYSPGPIEVKTYQLKGGSLSLHSAGFKQGSAVLVEIAFESMPISGPTFNFAGHDIALNRYINGYWGILPINPETRPGHVKFVLTYKYHGKTHTFSDNIKIKDAEFPVSTTRLDLGEHSDISTREDPDILARIQIEREKKNRAFASRSKNLLDNKMSHPRCMHFITSAFWAKRLYKRFRTVDGKIEKLPDTERIHRGLDLRGAEGQDVYALARGKVVLAEDLYFEGKMVILDHGNRIFSYYMHMSDIKVVQNEMVKAGQLIGLVGSTGMSTAPHLHISVIIDRIQVDPLSFLALPVLQSRH